MKKSKKQKKREKKQKEPCIQTNVNPNLMNGILIMKPFFEYSNDVQHLVKTV